MDISLINGLQGTLKSFSDVPFHMQMKMRDLWQEPFGDMWAVQFQDSAAATLHKVLTSYDTFPFPAKCLRAVPCMHYSFYLQNILLHATQTTVLVYNNINY